MCEKLIPIPGFEQYSVNIETEQVMSAAQTATGALKPLKVSSDGHVTLYRKREFGEAKSHKVQICLNKVIYAALNGLDPETLLAVTIPSGLPPESKILEWAKKTLSDDFLPIPEYGSYFVNIKTGAVKSCSGKKLKWVDLVKNSSGNYRLSMCGKNKRQYFSAECLVFAAKNGVSPALLSKRDFKESSDPGKDYLEIKGFSMYRIHEKTRQVISRTSGEWRPLKLQDLNKEHTLIADETFKVFHVRPLRLLFAAKNGINPMAIDSKYKVIEEDGDPVLVEAVITAKKLPPVDLKDAKKDLLFNIKFQTTILEAYDSGDYTKVFNMLWELRNEIIAYVRGRRFSRVSSDVEELWFLALDSAVEKIKNGRPPGGVLPYLKGIIRRQVSAKKERETIEKSFDDRDNLLWRKI